MKSRSLWLVLGLAGLSPTRTAAQVRAYDLDAIVRLVSAGVGAGVIERVKTSCVSFPLDAAAESRLRVAGADSAVMNAVRSACYAGSAIEVNTDQPGAGVWIAGRLVGKSPYSAHVNPSESPVLVEVSSGNWRDSVKTDLPPGTTLVVRFPAPEDTLVWPTTRKPLEIGEQLKLVDLWKGTRPRPELPAAPSRLRSVGQWLAAGVVSGAGGYLAARKGCSRTQGSYVVDSVTYPGFNLGASSGCVVGYTAPAAAIGALLYKELMSRRREAAIEGYPERLSRWEDVQRFELERWLSSHPQVRTVMATEAERRDQVREANRRAVEGNKERRRPSIAKQPTRS